MVSGRMADAPVSIEGTHGLAWLRIPSELWTGGRVRNDDWRGFTRDFLCIVLGLGKKPPTYPPALRGLMVELG